LASSWVQFARNSTGEAELKADVPKRPDAVVIATQLSPKKRQLTFHQTQILAIALEQLSFSKNSGDRSMSSIQTRLGAA
jgi:hypothetical protein